MRFPAFLDATALATFRSCEQKFKNLCLLPIRPKGERIDLIAGAAFAKGLEEARRKYVEGKDSDTCLAHGILALTKAFGSPDVPEKKRNKDWPRLIAGLESYLNTWPLHSDDLELAVIDGVPAIEFTFALPLPINHPDTGDPLLYCGRLDWIAKYRGRAGNNSGYYPVDDKTCISFREAWAEEWQMRGQFFGYIYAARQFGLNVAAMFVRGTALQLTQIKHQQALVYGEHWKVERWYNDLLTTVRRMITCYKTDSYIFDSGESCVSFANPCPYMRLCLSRDPTPWIDMYFQENTWNPLDLGYLDKPGATIGGKQLG